MTTPAGVLTAGGLSHADAIVRAAADVGLPLHIAAALVAKESGGRNIYGHDAGGVFSTRDGAITADGIRYERGTDVPVTESNFKLFLRSVLAGQRSNGVGPAQITYAGYFERSPEYKFWEPYANIKFGLTLLADYLGGSTTDASIQSAGQRYNGGNVPTARSIAYGLDLVAQAAVWRSRLATVTGPDVPTTYTVQPGDGLIGIARRVLGSELRWTDLYAWNRLTTTVLQPGQVLRLAEPDPVPEPEEARMPKVFLSPSDQDNNAVHGGGHEQQFAQIRANACADVLRANGIEVKISTAGVGDDSNGYIASINEGNAWGPDLYIADHSNAVGTGVTKRRGVYVYIWPKDTEARRLAQLVIDEVKPIFGDVPSGILDGSHLGEVNSANATSLLLELGYHDHPEDALIIRTRSVEIGQAEGRAIARFYGKTVPTTTTGGFLMALTDIQQDEIYARVMHGIPAGDASGRAVPDGSPARVLDSADGDYLRRQIEELRSVLGDVAAALAAPAPQRVQVEMDAAVEAAVEAAAEVGARRAFDGQTFTTTITAN